MAREHLPIQIGLPPEPAWQMSEPMPISYIAFVLGDEMPDPGEAFLAAGRAFEMAPQETEPLPIDDERVVWAFSLRIPRREARIMVWCERAEEGATPDGAASDAKWVVFVETLLDTARPVDDAISLAATAARTAGDRTTLLYDPSLGVAWRPAEFRELFFSDDSVDSGRSTTLVDERHLYRVELTARDRTNGPYWIATVGLARLAKPELEMLEVPVSLVRAALETIDALAARFVAEDLPAAGIPFEAGPDLRLALVPAAELMETLPVGAPGDAADRRGIPRGPRAAICAASKRGAFRQIWVSPTVELARLASNDTGLFLATRVVDVRATIARRTWSDFMAAHARDGAHHASAFLAKIARGVTDGERSHVWVAVASVAVDGGRGLLGRSGSEAVAVDFSLADVGDWRVVGLRADLPEVGPESAALLR